MKVKRVETPKVVKISVANHTEAAKLVKNKADTFNDIFGRSLKVYKGLGKIKDRINSLYAAQLNFYGGNVEMQGRLKEEHKTFMAWLETLEGD